MGWRYRKSKKLPGGFRINFSKSGIGYSWGVKGFRITKTANGKIRKTYSIPGTGVSYVTEEAKRRKAAHAHLPQNTGMMTEAPLYKYGDKRFKSLARQIGIFPVFLLSALILIILGCCLYNTSIIASILFIVAGLIEVIFIFTIGRVEIPISDKSGRGIKLLQAFSSLGKSEYVWQIDPNMPQETVRLPVAITARRNRPYIKCDSEALGMNLHAGELILVRGKMILFNGYKAGIVRAKDLTFTYEDVNFREELYSPSDCITLSTDYKHTNKDGSPDKRYKDNPIIHLNRYGAVNVSAPTGLCFTLLVSNAEIAQRFVEQASHLYDHNTQVIRPEENSDEK